MTQFKNILPVLWAGLLVLSLESCDNEAQEDALEVLSELEAVAIIDASLQPESGSLGSNLKDATIELVTAVDLGEVCDNLYTKTIENTYDGNVIQSSYASELSYELSCNLVNIPLNATFSSATNGQFSSPTLESVNDVIFNGTISELLPTSQTLTFVGNFTKT